MAAENISVSVRVRPLNEKEQTEGIAWTIESNNIIPFNPKSNEPMADNKYTLDRVFGPQWTTQQVYEATTQGIVQKVLEGFNGTVFAYGQTSSGKTHSMKGTDSEPGIIPLSIHDTFQLISSQPEREFLVRVSFFELYNEEIRDLLAPENVNLAVRESKEQGVYVAGLREEVVTSPEQVLQLLREGEAHRHVGETKMNKQSSRSHTLFRMVIESRSRLSQPVSEGEDPAAQAPAIDPAAANAAVRVSALTLVDLAGSERIAKTGAEGVRMKEGTAINKSLLALGTVINKLSEGDGSHIPYRDSKLTRILQPSLGGNAKTAVICAVTPAAIHAEETHSTLRFACRAKKVQNHAVVNEVSSGSHALLKKAQREIEELKARLANQGSSENEIAELRLQLQRAQEELARRGTFLVEGDEDGAAPLNRKRRSRSQSAWADGEEEGGESDGEPTPQRRRFGASNASESDALRGRLEQAEEELREVREERDRLAKVLPQLEEAKWKNRQLERKIEEIASASAGATELQAELAALREQLQLKEQQVQRVSGELVEERLRAREEVSSLQAALTTVQAEAEELRLKHSLAGARESDTVAALQKALEAQREKERELADAKALAESLEEQLRGSEERCRELFAENERLENHCHDLATQKRAPLYQRKQEAELKAALDKAVECELRANEAEARLKEAVKLQEGAEKSLREVTEERDALQKQLEVSLAAAEAAHAEAIRKLTAVQLAQQAKHDEVVAALRKDLAKAEGDRSALEDSVAELRGQMHDYSARFADVEDAYAAAQQAANEAQLCADAAAERNRALEDELEMVNLAKEGLESQLQQLQEEATAAAERAQAELAELSAERARLEAELNKASAGIKAATELKELKSKFKVEVATLQREKQAAEKAVKMGTQKGSKEVDLAKKELERLKDQLKKTEEKLRGALGDKSAAVSEKAKVELALKQLQGKHEVVAKQLEKKDAVDAKRREELQAALDASKKQFQAASQELEGRKADVARLEAALAAEKETLAEVTAREEHLRVLQASLESQLEDSRGAVMEQKATIEELQSQLQGREGELQSLQGDHAKALQSLAAAQEQVAALKETEAKLRSELQELQSGLASCQSELEVAERERKAAEARLPEIPELRKQVAELNEQLTDLSFRSEEDRAASQAQIRMLTTEREALDAKLHEVMTERSSVQSDLVRSESRVLELEAKGQELTGRLADVARRLEAAEGRVAELQGEVSDLTARGRAEREEARETERSLKSDLERVELRVRELTREVTGKTDENAFLQTELERIRHDWAASTEELEGKLSAERKAVRSLESQLDEAGRSRSELQRQLERAQGEQQDVSARLAESVDHVARLHSKVDELEEVILDLKSKGRDLAEEVEAQRRRAEGLASSLEEAGVELETERSRSRSLQLEADNARIESETHSRRATQEAHRASKAEEEVALALQRISHLESQIQLSDEVANECRELLDQQQRRIVALEKEIEAVHRNAEREKEEIMLSLATEQRKGAAAEDARRAADELKARISKERERADRSERDACALREQCTRLDSELQLRETDLRNLRARLVEAERDLADDRRSLSDRTRLQSEITVLQQQIESLRGAVEGKDRQLSQAAAEVSAAQGRIASLEAQLQASSSSLRAKTAESEAAQVKLQEAAAKLSNLSTWAKEAQREIEAGKALKKRVTALESDLKARDDSIRALEARVQSASSATSSSSVELTVLRNQVTSLHGDLAETRAALAESTAQLARVESELSASKSELEPLTALNTELQRKVQQLQRDSERQLASIQRLSQELKKASTAPAAVTSDAAATTSSVPAGGMSQEASARLAQLEAAYREEKRNNVKLQALYTKLKNDVTAKGVSEESFRQLWEVASVEFDKDYAEGKIRMAESKNRKLAEEVESLKKQLQAAGGPSLLKPLATVNPNVAAAENPLSAKRQLRTVARVPGTEN